MLLLLARQWRFRFSGLFTFFNLFVLSHVFIFHPVFIVDIWWASESMRRISKFSLIYLKSLTCSLNVSGISSPVYPIIIRFPIAVHFEHNEQELAEGTCGSNKFALYFCCNEPCLLLPVPKFIPTSPYFAPLPYFLFVYTSSLSLAKEIFLSHALP